MPGSGYVRLVSGEPQVVWMPGGVRTEIHLVSDDTDGAFCLLVDEPPAGWSLPPHLHRGVAETIYIIEGEFEMEIDGERSALVAGQTVHVELAVPISALRNWDVEKKAYVVPAGTYSLAVGASSADIRGSREVVVK